MLEVVASSGSAPFFNNSLTAAVVLARIATWSGVRLPKPSAACALISAPRCSVMLA